MHKFKGIWFFGLSGSGKSFASSYLNELIDNSFIIDGDTVRTLISNDLGYDIKSREIQIQRIFGIADIALKNRCFPIISSVYMNAKIAKKLTVKGICLYKIERDMNNIFKSHPTYTKNLVNIVGVDIPYEQFNYQVLTNNEENFCKQLIKLIS